MKKTFEIIKEYPYSHKLGYRFTVEQEKISNNALYLKYPEFFKEIKESNVREFKPNQWLYATTNDEEILLRYNGVNPFNAIITSEYYWLKDNKVLHQGSSNVGLIQQDMCMVATDEQKNHILSIIDPKYSNILKYYINNIGNSGNPPIDENVCKEICVILDII